MMDLKFYSGTVQEVIGVHSREWETCELVSVFVRSRLHKGDLDRFPALRAVCTRSTGYDHIELSEANRRAIVVSNVPAYGENTVAEHTFALILALSRNLRRAYIQARQGRIDSTELQGFDLEGKTLGVIGAGRIGLHAIKIAKGFGMRVLAYDIRHDQFLAELLGFRYAELDEVFRESHVISLHAPYSAHTHHIIDRTALKKIRKGAILINTARGELVDTEALVWALDEGIIAGAGLDVLEGEGLMGEEDLELLTRTTGRDHLLTLVTNHLLLNRENVIITPHIAFNSAEAVGRIRAETTENVMSFISGRPRNVVNNPMPPPPGEPVSQIQAMQPSQTARRGKA